MTGKRNRPILERFEEKFIRTGSCWIWIATGHERGYGHFFTGKHESGRKMDYAINVITQNV